MAAIIPGTPLHSFLDAIRKATSEVFSQALGASWSVEIDSSAVVPTAETSFLYFQLSTSGGLQGNAAIQVKTPDALALAQKFLAEAVDPAAELNPDRKEALEELLRQIAGLAATALTSVFGETKLGISMIEPPTWQGVSNAFLASDGSGGKMTLELRLSPELLTSVSAPPAPPPAREQAASPEVKAGAVTRDPAFDLLLGVNLSLTLRFAQRTLPLREVLDLNAGSIIDLHREVQEPADLLLGDKVIAKGQVVVVDGDYGLRITEVTDVQPQIGTP